MAHLTVTLKVLPARTHLEVVGRARAIPATVTVLIPADAAINSRLYENSFKKPARLLARNSLLSKVQRTNEGSCSLALHFLEIRTRIQENKRCALACYLVVSHLFSISPAFKERGFGERQFPPEQVGGKLLTTSLKNCAQQSMCPMLTLVPSPPFCCFRLLANHR